MQSKFSWIVGVVVLVFAFAILFMQEPERVRAISDDGNTWIDAKVSSNAKLSIKKYSEASPESFTALLGSVYEATPDGLVLPTTATVTMKFDSKQTQDIPKGNVRIGAYDKETGFWRLLKSDVDNVNGRVIAKINKLSLFALMFDENIDVSFDDFEKQVTALASSPPPGAVGHVAELAYSAIDGDFVKVDSMESTGGCYGKFQRGNSTTITTSEYESGGLNYRIVMIWQIDGGCGE
ncbi:MAG: hypothetical protein ACD_76C00059G0001 [uncultured bacterium]|nr:MAG: hypothetical protein ACD_76C00059G0001 [uncultured bacterium]HBD05299.1 hypothetical protein [Candidatus Uhrbacteria bacterium]